MKRLFLYISFAVCLFPSRAVDSKAMLLLVDSAYNEAMAGRLQHAVMINEDGLRQIPADSVAIRCEFYSCLLYCYHRLGDYEQALHYGELCLQYDEKQGNLSNLSASLGNLAGIYSSAGKHDVAIDYLNRSIAIEEELLQTDKEHTAKSLAIRKAMLGEVLLAKAKAEREKSKEKSAVSSDSANHIQLSTFDFEQSDISSLLEQALTLTDEALRIDRSLERQLQVGMRLSQMGNIYAELGDKDKARRCNEEALDIARKTNNRMTEVITLLQLGRNGEAVKIAHELGMKKQELEACNSLYKQSAGSKQYAEALRWLERARELEQQIRTEDAERQLTLWQVRYDTQRKEQQIAIQEQTIGRQKAEKRWLVAFIIVALLALVFFSLFACALARRKREIEEASRAKDRHYTILTHDLKNPMVAQQQVLRMLYCDYERYTADEIHANVGRLLAGSDTQLELLQNLSEIALLELGKRQTLPTRIDLGSIITDAVNAMRSVAMLKHITFVTHAERLLVTADRDTVRTILRNLLSNAIKFSYEGATVEIGTRQPNQLYVKDTGMGMTEEKRQELLTSKAVISSSKGTLGEGGTGIGILLCRELLNLNHGTMEIESEQGKGTTFIIMLPKSEE